MSGLYVKYEFDNLKTIGLPNIGKYSKNSNFGFIKTNQNNFFAERTSVARLRGNVYFMLPT